MNSIVLCVIENACYSIGNQYLRLVIILWRIVVHVVLLGSATYLAAA
jgi:hypothetical protein